MKPHDLIQLIDAALGAREPDYARQVAQAYLAEWPGDLAVQWALARALVAVGHTAQAVCVLRTLLAADPEDFRAQRLLGDLLRDTDQGASAEACACAHVGDGRGGGPDVKLPPWAEAARAAFLAEAVGDWETARAESQTALGGAAGGPLPSLVHLAAVWHAGQLDLAYPLARGFHSRWPQVVAFKLCLAECLMHRQGQEMNGGERAWATELLHEASVQDLEGRVAARHWGEAHPYRGLWSADERSLCSLPGPLPAGLIAALGLNRLPRGAGLSEAHAPAPPPRPAPARSEELRDIHAQLDLLAARLSGKRADGVAQPARRHYLVLSSRTRLIQAYGMDGFAAVDRQLKHVSAQASARAGMVGHLLYVDDPASLQSLGLRPVNPSNAWDVKGLLGEVAARLGAHGGAIGAVLIAGGEEIIPFHRLPNPTDDLDPDIPSDNPYATPDENYFVPEWPVGRIPSAAGSDPRPFIRALAVAAGSHGARPARDAAKRFWHWLRGLWHATTAKPSFGYTASVWKRASAAVYAPIGEARDLLASPPLDAEALPRRGLAPARLSYFNLHGIEDGPDWYGQSSLDGWDDGAEALVSATQEFPVALRPADVANSGRAPQVVFSEACYGANSINKGVEDALCLRFLDAGSRAVVGSTKIAYGSVTTPLVGADLLGRHFWQNVSAGLPVGEALRRAKLEMAQEMHTRQGFLDGEDQKTLISFVLYGDPLVTAPSPRGPKAARAAAPKLAEAPATICDRADGGSPASGPPEADIQPETVARIKKVVAQYLPGMGDAAWSVAQAHGQCAGRHHACPTAQLSRLQAHRPAPRPHTTVVTLSKTIRSAARAHPRYARLTLDDKGAIVKLAVSR